MVEEIPAGVENGITVHRAGGSSGSGQAQVTSSRFGSLCGRRGDRQEDLAGVCDADAASVWVSDGRQQRWNARSQKALADVYCYYGSLRSSADGDPIPRSLFPSAIAINSKPAPSCHARKILSALSSISYCFLAAACSPQILPSQYVVYVDSATSGVLVPLRDNSGITSAPVQFGGETQAMALASSENVLYILNSRIKDDRLIGTAIPYDLTTKRPAAPITVGTRPSYIALTPDGRTIYIANNQSGTVTPINVPTDTASKPIRVGLAPSICTPSRA